MTFKYFNIFYGQFFTTEIVVNWIKSMQFNAVCNEIADIEQETEHEDQYNELITNLLNDLNLDTNLSYLDKLITFNISEVPHDQLPNSQIKTMYIVGIKIG